MSGTLREGTEPSPNRNITVSQAAISTIYGFPLAFSRKDLSNQERIKYTYEWNVFDQVWAYNYTVSTLNGQSGNYIYSPYQYLNLNERLAYTNGQLAHIAYYSTAGAAGQFNNIRF